jgi:protein TonB
MKERSLAIPFLSSLMMHAAIMVLAVTFVPRNRVGRPEFIPVEIIETPAPPPAPAKQITPPEPKPEPRPKIVKPLPQPKPKIAKPPEPAPQIKEEPLRPRETKPPPPAASQTFASGSNVEGGGSEAAAGKLFQQGDVGVIPGPETSGGGRGTAVSGLGHGSGAPGLPAETGPVKTNREAKAIQTARATYPPMALRMGLESDVTLEIVVDSTGNVIKAEIIKSGGPGFDEEALKAVKQSRFEPAHRDGRSVPAEFTYIYRFRLQR